MPAPPRLARALVSLLTRGEVREVILGDLDEEFHDRLAAGWSAPAARRRYWRQAIASVTSMGRDRLSPEPSTGPGDGPGSRAARLAGLIVQDVKYGVRLVGRHRAFAAAAVVTLALGIGANTAVFTVAWHTLLRPLPYPDAHRLVTVWEVIERTGALNTVMPANYRDWEREGRSFDAIAAFGSFRDTADFIGDGEPDQWRLRYVTARYFDVFRLRPLIGRPLNEADAARFTVILSEGVWRRHFAADPDIAGREIRLNDRTALIAGVMPARFEEAAGQVEAWVAFALPADVPSQRQTAHYLGVVARLKSDVTVAQAQGEVAAIAARAAERYPRENRGLSATVRSVADDRGATVRSGLTLTALAALAVLAIACANLGSLQFSRTAGRMREFGIRTSLGASRGRIVAQLVTEGLVMAAAGTALGLALGVWLLAVVRALAPASVQRAAAQGPTVEVVLGAVGLALASALAFAIWPAWQAGTRAAASLGQRTDAGDRRSRTVRGTLVTGQIALAVVLLAAAATLGISLRNVLSVDPGFRPDGLLTFDLSLARTRFDTYRKREAFVEAVRAEVSSLPGITGVCAINQIPFDPLGHMTYVPEGRDVTIAAAPRTVTPGCLEVIGVRLVRGRTIGAAEPVRAAVVSEAFARSAWSTVDVSGRRIHVGTKNGALVEVVGVVEDVRQESLERAGIPQVYEVASERAPFWPHRIIARTSGPPDTMFDALRTAVRRVDPTQPVANLRALKDVMGDTIRPRWFDLSLVSVFSAIALVLSAVGLYGLLAQIVAQRTGEIGIRLALGATSRSVVRLVMRTAWIAVAVGGTVGLAGAAAASGMLRRFVFGISPTEPALHLGAAGVLALVALAAAWIPARRAARVDPVRTLRQT